MDSGAAIPALYLGGLFLLLAWQTRARSGYPSTFRLHPEPVSGLDPKETNAFMEVGKDLEALGFRAVGDYRTNFQPGGWEDSQQIEQYRFWLSADRQITASLRHVAFLNHAGSGISRTALRLGFQSWSEDGRCAQTQIGEIDLPIPVPGVSERGVPIGAKMAVLMDHHRRHFAEAFPGTMPAALRDEEPVQRYSAVWETEMAWYQRIGFFRPAGEGMAPTLLMGLWLAARSMNPFVHEPQKTWGVALRLGAGMVAALAAAWFLRRSGWNVTVPVGMGIAYAILAVYSAVLIRRTILVSWIFMAAPSFVLMAAQGHGSHTAWLSGIGAAVCLSIGIERSKYRKESARMGAVPETRPWTTKARVIAVLVLISCAGVAILSHVACRTPMEAAPWVYYAAFQSYAFLAASVLVLVLGLPLYLFKSVRRRPWFRWMKVASLGAVLIVAGGYSAALILKSEEQVLDARGAQFLKALRQFKKDTGSYPTRLSELRPRWLPDVTDSDSRFYYASALLPDGTTQYWIWYSIGWKQKALDPEEPPK